MNFYVYNIHPIDWGWSNLKTVSQTISDFAKSKDMRDTPNPVPNDLDEELIKSFLGMWEAAKEKAKEKGWEGDFRDEPCVFWLPTEQYFDYGFVFKQENNGSTFVVSPYPLSWLDWMAS